ncbi:MAG: DNA polymerase Y family protein [Alphaproteobacteria bacterium]
MDRRVVSVWLPWLASECARPLPSPTDSSASRPEPGAARAAPFVLTAREGNALRLAAVDRRAAAEGLAPGMALADARALLPDLATRTLDPLAAPRRAAELARWAQRYAPWTAAGEPEAGGAGALWLDITGAAHLAGGEAALAADLVVRLAALGHDARVAIAGTAGAAWGLARFAPGSAPAIVASGGEAAALAALPPAALRLPAAVAETLGRLGVRRIDVLAALPRAGLTARFGAVVAQRLDQALGRAAEPLSPDLPAPVRRVRLAFPEPVENLDTVAAAARRLSVALARHLASAGEGVRRLELSLFRCDGRVDTVDVGLARPSRDAAHMARLLADRLAALAPASGPAAIGIDTVVLSAVETATLDPAQAALSRHGGAAGEVAALADRLAARLGGDAVFGLAAQASHLPERAQRAVSAGAPAPAVAMLPPAAAQRRPPRLLARPEPVEAVAPVPDDPPLLFRWRGRRHRIARAEGPERLAPEWWRDPAAEPDTATRDYYRVENEDGDRFWLFRRGLYGSGRGGGPAPAWFLHGFFG